MKIFRSLVRGRNSYALQSLQRTESFSIVVNFQHRYRHQHKSRSDATRRLNEEVRVLLDRNEPKKALKVLNKVTLVEAGTGNGNGVDRKVNADQTTYMHKIAAYSKLGQLKKAMSTFEEMNKAGIVPTLSVFDTALANCPRGTS